MRSTMKTAIILSMLALMCNIDTNAQNTIEGRVTDKETRQPLESATVIIQHTADATVINYTLTDTDGRFRLTVSSPQSVKLGVLYMGYKKVLLPIDPTHRMEIALEPETILLKEVQIRPGRIWGRQDTLKYDLTRFTSSQDRNVGDVLKKLPGINVEENGTIKYNGKEISNFYVEGMDVSGGRYNQINNNLKADAVQSAEVIEHVSYHKDQPDELAVINYTSGTTSYSKGVMLPYRSLWSNTTFAFEVLPLKAGDKIVSMLPMAHMYGLAFEFLYEFAVGCHIFFLTRMPSPKIIFQAFTEVKPNLIVAVPLIIEKIIKKSVLPKLETPAMKLLLKVPIINDKIKATVREQMIQAFGGNFAEVIVGGAAFNQEVEQFLKMIDFPYTVGYGMTECGPIICYEDWTRFKPGSCGKAAPRMEVKILSSDPENIPGEIVCRGPNVMLGYYKNDEATVQVLDKDGWLHTGDLALMDAEGNVSIKGRSKNMLLGPSGQNIYPEEIEDKLNNMPYVAESIIVQQNEKLVGLVYPDFDDAFAHGLNNDDIERVMEETVWH